MPSNLAKINWTIYEIFFFKNRCYIKSHKIPSLNLKKFSSLNSRNEAKKDLNKKKQENLIIRKITKKADIAITHKEIRESMNIQNESDEEQFHNY